MNTKQFAAIEKHGRNLLSIFPNAVERDPVKLCKKLRRIEAKGAALALRLCNGPQFPYPDDAEKISGAILSEANALLGNESVPIFVNLDPRGYALKIQDFWVRNYLKPDRRIYTDMGGYGIIAPEINANGD